MDADGEMWPLLVFGYENFLSVCLEPEFDRIMDAFVDNVMACGARGIVSEPFTDYNAIARRHKNCFIAGEGGRGVTP